jgi:hypothetical protein
MFQVVPTCAMFCEKICACVRPNCENEPPLFPFVFAT